MFKDLPLLISLVFGAAQCIFGVAVLAHGTRGGRWRRTGTFVLVSIGAWAICSGAAELLVSGLDVATRATGVPAPSVAASIRALADGALVAVSVVLLLTLVLFSAWKRTRTGASPPRRVAQHKD